MWRDETYLVDILIAAKRIVEYCQGLTQDNFNADYLRQDAVMRNIGIVGEAARKISDEVKLENQQIPWSDIVGMRNRLIHEYFRIDIEKVWDTVQKDIPSLIKLIEPLVPPE